jgi:hypothetical protein
VPRPVTSVHHLTANTDPNIQITIVPESHHKIHDLSWLDFRKIKNCQQPTLRADGYFLSRARENDSMMPTLVWEPANATPTPVPTTAQYPTFVICIQLEGSGAFMLVYLNTF